jgi:Leucine-rich repeat (LRR) protein
MGRLMSRPVRPEEPVDDVHFWVRDDDWRVLGQAQGDVAVPAGHQVCLLVQHPQAWRDLAPLMKLRPDDLYKLGIGGLPNGSRAGDSCMQYVAHLTGLRVLELSDTSIGGVGLKYVTALKSLRRLTVPDRMDDAGMVYLAELPALTGLYFRENRVTNAGLKHLAKLRGLEELALGGGQITNDGLAHLAGLPRLRYLMLSGNGFTDAGFAHLRSIPNLEILHVGLLPQTTDAGVAHIAEIPSLKDVTFHWSKNITNAGLVPLKKLAHLRRLDVRYSRVTDEGLAHLRDIKTLEGLILPHEGITDKGFQYLSELPRLRELNVTRILHDDPKKDRGGYTNEGLKALSKLALLETLHVAGWGVTDAGIKHLAGLAHMKDLRLSGCGRITDESLRTVGGLRSLERLGLYKGQLTVSGLKALNGLTNLKYLQAEAIGQDNSGLDLSGLTNLEDLLLTLRTNRVAKSEVCEPFQEQDIAALGRLTRLKRLGLSNAGATNAALRQLTGLKRLEHLALGGGSLTDDGLACLVELPKLDDLTLSGPFTDGALKHLQKVPNLWCLTLSRGARFSAAAVSDFKRNMPTVIIFRGYEIDGGPRPSQPAGVRRN